VLEFQSRPRFTYMIEKTSYCCTVGLRVHWILHGQVFRPFLLCGDGLEAIMRRRLEIL
jgi:hypothetical protein